MKTKSSPSEYRYCISRRSTVAVSTLVPALNVRSTTWPVSTFLSLVRTNAPPLPGLTCWNSTTFHSTQSRSSVMPFLRSLVVAIGRVNPSRRSVRRPPRLPNVRADRGERIPAATAAERRRGGGAIAPPPLPLCHQRWCLTGCDLALVALLKTVLVVRGPATGVGVGRVDLDAVATDLVDRDLRQLVVLANLHGGAVRRGVRVGHSNRDRLGPGHRHRGGHGDGLRGGVDRERRHLLGDVGGVGLRRRLVRLLLLVQEQRDGDRGENADDDHDDQELDEREALLLLVHGLAEPCEHCGSSSGR